MDTAYPYYNNPSKFVSWLVDRLRDIPDVDWDDAAPLHHSSRDEWHVRGYRRQVAQSPATTNGSQSPTTPSRSSPSLGSRPSTPRQRSSETYPFHNSSVIARVSNKSLRLDRQYQLARTIGKTSDPKGKFHVRALQLFRLAPRNDVEPQLTVILLDDAGPNALWDMVNYGANWYSITRDTQILPQFNPHRTASGNADVGKTHLPTFLDIAIGATSCVEVLHTGHHVIHAELRGDSVRGHRIRCGM